MADEIVGRFGTNSRPYLMATLLDSITASAATTGSVIAFSVPMNQFCVQTIWGGSAPATTTVILEGSIDGTNFNGMSSTTTVAATNQLFFVTDHPVMYIRGKYTEKSAGGTTTLVTIKALAYQG